MIIVTQKCFMERSEYKTESDLYDTRYEMYVKQ